MTFSFVGVITLYQHTHYTTCGQEVVHYFAEEADADAAISASAIQEILSLAGSWSDLNWDVVEEELYRIRHESRPTPPISIK